MAEEERHIIRVPNWIWKWAQDRTGKSRPSSFLSDLLSEAVHLQRVGLATSKDDDDEDEPAEETGRDYGRVITAEFATVCDTCGQIIDHGEEAVIRTNDRGRKEMLHIDHLRRTT